MQIDEYGAGDDVTVFLHGNPTTPGCFGPMIEELAQERRVLVVHYPGYGASPPLEGEYTLPRVQALLEDELCARRVGPLSVVGFSSGA